MSDEVRLRFLGTGTSHGVPVIGCPCAVCHSANPRNKRYRPSVLVEWREQSLLVDAPPELRLQLLRTGTTKVHAVLITHTHADHVFGLDDIRVFNQRGHGAVPVYGTAESLANLRRHFFYAFTDSQAGGGKPQLDLRLIDPIDHQFEVGGCPIQPIPVLHGTSTVLGYRFGDVAYVTDTNFIGSESLNLLRNLDVLVLDALRDAWHPTHFNVAEAIAVVTQLRPRRALFTHICHDLDHDVTNRRLPAGIELAYDDLIVRGGAGDIGPESEA